MSRPHGIPNKATAAIRAEIARTGKSMLEILIDNARRLDQLLGQFELEPTAENLAIVTRFIEMSAVLSQVADRAAKYLHAPQMAIKHEHTLVDGKPVRPVLEITGYPATKEVAPPTPALPPAGTKH
jgi:hypothetical protein